MSRFLKKICVYVFLMLMVTNFGLAYTEPVYNSTDNSNKNFLSVSRNNGSINSQYRDYVLESYDIDILVGEDNVLKITERIGVYFYNYKHGITRKIPLQNKIVDLDGTSLNSKAKIRNVKVNEKYSLSTVNGNKLIKIGNKDTSIRGPKNYEISYLYDIGKDNNINYDELYFNLIGPDWDTSIENTAFRITMPKGIDKNRISFTGGRYGSTDNSRITYVMKDNVITGKYNGTLGPYQALTVRMVLPEGYFSIAKDSFDVGSILIIATAIILVLIAIFWWYKFGRDDKVVDTVEFYPPNGLNSADVGFLYKGKAEDKHVISLLIYLAHKGYIKIEETGKDPDSLLEDFKIVKMKEYDGDDDNERMFLYGLFKSIKLQREHIEVTAKSLRNDFYKTVEVIKKRLKSKENKEKFFEKKSLDKCRWIAVMMLTIFLIITARPVLEYSSMDKVLYIAYNVLAFMGIFCILPSKRMDSSIKIGIGIIVVLSLLTIFIKDIYPALQDDNAYKITYIVGIICIIVLGVVLAIMPKRTRYGIDTLGKVEGFRKFLLEVEKPKLEMLVKENPNYFYDILPYTYALDISDTWIEKYEELAIEQPDWYSCATTFNLYNFGIFMNTIMMDISEIITTETSSTSNFTNNTFSGGSGFSGGGFGGGGGGAW